MSKSQRSPQDKALTLRDIRYWINWFSKCFPSGGWDSQFRGRGFDFQGTVSYLDDPDLTRINVPATQAEGELQVSVYREEHSIQVYLLGDLAPSMAFGSERTKLDRLALLGALFAFSASRAHDDFRFVGYADGTEQRFPRPTGKEYPLYLAQAILNFRWQGRRRGGLLRTIQNLPAERTLVVIVSDLLGSLEEMEGALRFLADRHEVLPIVLWDQREVIPPRGFGFLPLADLETGRMRHVLLCGPTRGAWERNVTERKSKIEELFGRFGVKPFFFTERERTDLEELMRLFLIKRAVV